MQFGVWAENILAEETARAKALGPMHTQCVVRTAMRRSRKSTET